MAEDETSTALIENCKRLSAIKYRIDDFIEALWRRDFRAWGEANTSLTVDWLDEIARDPGLDDKEWLDKHAPETNQPERARNTVYTLNPAGFAECVFPFFRLYAGGRSEPVFGDVDPFLVIGGTRHRTWPRILGDEALAEINRMARTGTPGCETAYVKLGALPLYVAYEGKNRVRAFRAAGRDISAFIYSGYFPDARMLQLHEVADSLSFAFSYVASGKPHALILPSVTVPLLESYGVPRGKRISLGMVRYRRALKRDLRKMQSALISGNLIA